MQGWERDKCKADVLNHPLYDQLLAAHVSCLRIATPVDQLPRIDAQLAQSQSVVSKYSLLAQAHPPLDDRDLDLFMTKQRVKSHLKTSPPNLPNLPSPPSPTYLDGSVVPTSDDDDEWFQLDALLQGWILSTITDEVSDLVISSTTAAASLWKVIHDLFHDNKHARAMQLEHQFRTTVKGNTPMATYCQNLYNIADWLDDVDAPVSQHQLVLQMLRGLPEDLQAQTSFLQFQDPLPTFLQARSALLVTPRNLAQKN
ncbi:unnamed protein product [Cuscuta campestris]|uniref:KNOX1 domain-containing protein n=1 Tax=Cuscuta campestris TaxID=132261 RepID=A0A484K5W8_9ASTE|nr:unnamed protein product [Cuscuta campestris]